MRQNILQDGKLVEQQSHDTDGRQMRTTYSRWYEEWIIEDLDMSFIYAPDRVRIEKDIAVVMKDFDDDSD